MNIPTAAQWALPRLSELQRLQSQEQLLASSSCLKGNPEAQRELVRLRHLVSRATAAHYRKV